VAGFTDLIPQAQPALADGGCFAEATAGATWEWTFSGAVDSANNPVDFTGITGTCVVTDGASTVVTLTVTGTVGGFTVSKAKASTTALNDGEDRRQCSWSLYFDDGTERLWVWNSDNSVLVIKAGS
jgi:hypothetical protein